ncbi:Actin-related protein 8, partial [Mucuna pruriens]
MWDELAGTLALYAAEQTSGIAVNIGFEVTSIVPILNGKVMRKVGVEVVGLGAVKLTGFLREQMQQNNIRFESMYTVRKLKENWQQLHIPVGPQYRFLPQAPHARKHSSHQIAIIPNHRTFLVDEDERDVCFDSEKLDSGLIYVPTGLQVANIFSKGLLVTRFQELNGNSSLPYKRARNKSLGPCVQLVTIYHMGPRFGSFILEGIRETRENVELAVREGTKRRGQ